LRRINAELSPSLKQYPIHPKQALLADFSITALANELALKLRWFENELQMGEE
jgi:hypothetical protein